MSAPGTIPHIVIIGGSVSGIFTFCKLIDLKIDHDCFKPLNITLIEKRAQLGEGWAYDSSYCSNVLNTAAGLLSGVDTGYFCLNNVPTFLKWVRTHTSQWQNHYPTLSPNTISVNSYLPRGLVGLYLRDIVKHYQLMAPLYHVYVSIIHQEAITLTQLSPDTYGIGLKEGKKLYANTVVLATGNFMQEQSLEIKQKPYYFPFAWPTTEQLERLLTQDSITILGSRLSALDTLAILRSHHYQGQIYLVSRTGFLPTVKNQHHFYQPKLFTVHSLTQLNHHSHTPMRLNDVINLLKLELEHATQTRIHWSKLLTPQRFSLAWLKWQIQLAQSEKTIWQSVLAAIDTTVITAWQYLNQQERQQFVQQFAYFWDIYRFSMPLDTAQSLLTLVQQQQLTLCAQPEFTFNDRTFQFSAIDCSRQRSISVTSAALINATGIHYDVTTIASPLLQNILRQQLATPDHFGGFQVNTTSFQTIQNNNLFMLGNLTKGSYFFTNSYLICAQQAATVATHLFDQYQKENTRKIISIPAHQIVTRQMASALAGEI